MGAEVTELILPGLHGSGPDHWQSRWSRIRPRCRRVELGEWDRPTPTLWASRLDRAVARTPGPVILVAHSLGCHAVAWWAAQTSAARHAKVRGALLVAPPDVDREGCEASLLSFAPTPALPLPFRAWLVASHDDPYARFERSAWMARIWGCSLLDAGHLGHINADSGLGDWPQGLAYLARLRSEAISPLAEAPHEAGRIGDTGGMRH